MFGTEGLTQGEQYVTFQGGVLAASMQVTLCVLLLGEPQGAWINVLWYLVCQEVMLALQSSHRPCTAAESLLLYAPHVDHQDVQLSAGDLDGRHRCCSRGHYQTTGLRNRHAGHRR